ncbi:hypothetical protein JTB14_013987 [Gonioctena quinquepunctata]|nr:hypothetical protein JTB14_013987 [Gonioctena quinquepunctata]
MFSKNAIEEFRQILATLCWDFLYQMESTNEAFILFNNTFSHYFNSIFPLKKCSAGTYNRKLWLNDEIRESSRNLKEFFRLAKSFPELQEHYRDWKKTHYNLIRATKKTFYQNKISESDTPIGMG